MTWKLCHGDSLLEQIPDDSVNIKPGPQKKIRVETFQEPPNVIHGLKDPGYVEFSTKVTLRPLSEYTLVHHSGLKLKILVDADFVPDKVRARIMSRQP